MNMKNRLKSSLPHFFIAVFVFFGNHSLSAQQLLTLDEAIQIALENSPDIIQSELNMTIKLENLRAKEATTKSNFSFQVTPYSYSQSRGYDDFAATWNTNRTTESYGEFIVSQPIVPTDTRISLRNQFGYQDAYSEYSGVSNTGFNNNLYLQLSQPLFSYNKIKMELDQLKLELENSTYSYALQRMYLEQQVTQFFYAVYQRQMSLDISKDEYENQKTSYEIIKSKVEGGLSAQEELFQAELNLATSESSLQNSQVELANAKDQFKEYIGMPLNKDFDIIADVDFKYVLIDQDKAINHGLNSRLELQQREIDLQNSHNNLTMTKDINKFGGNVDLSVGIFGENEQLPQIYETPTRSPAVMLTFNIPIWDWGERKSRIKAAEASIRIQEINISNEKTNIELEIRQIYRNLQNLVMQVDIAEKNVKNAQLTYDINLERYRNGDLTSMDLDRYQNQLSEKKMSLSTALINYKLELLNLKVKSLWDFENDASFVPKDLLENIKD